MLITAEYINNIHDALIPVFRAIPFENGSWSTVCNDDDYGHFELKLALTYASTFKYETFEEGTDDSRTPEEVIEEWKQSIAEATTTNPTEYKGDTRLIDDAIYELVCNTNTEDEDMNTYLVHQLIELRDKIHNEKQV